MTTLRVGALLTATLLAGWPSVRTPFHRDVPPRIAPRLEANDQRTPAGRVVDGELRVELDVVDAVWSPEATKRDSQPTVAFAERGHAPQNPGPLLRMQVGQPVRISLRNTLNTPVHVRGLGDRVRGDTAVSGRPAFMRRDALVLAPGEEREVRFTPSAAVTSFYFAGAARGSEPPPPVPFAALVGAFVVDAAGATPPPNERIFLISLSQGLTINGLGWPQSERLRYAEGDTVRWRVINASDEYHPMHLHGFYFTVQARGDAQADTSIATARPLQVTEGMREFGTMQLSWTAETPGNWLFHCHLIIHSQGEPAEPVAASATTSNGTSTSADAHTGDMPMHDAMAGLILGITVTPRVAGPHAAPAAARRLDLWTGTRASALGDSAGLGFVVQRGRTRPAPDSITTISSPLVLMRGEPTRIVVHNRLPVPLAVHWHGMELMSTYDGVGHWSGIPGNTRAPISAGDSTSVYMTPPREGTFMYHVHGESGPGLQQGMYGALVVLEKGRTMNAETDRLFVLASRGATQDAEPSINGRAIVPAERFALGTTHRLRFAHISTNDIKTIRLLHNGKPVQWRLRARDGATLPAQLRAFVVAEERMDVGQTFDVEWTPKAAGVHVLEVTTRSILFAGGKVQRVAFGVGAVTDAAMRVATTGTLLPLADVPIDALGKLAGVYATVAGSTDAVSLWRSATGLSFTRTTNGSESAPSSLMSLADGSFVPAVNDSGLWKAAMPSVSYRIDGATLTVGTGASAQRFARVAAFPISDDALARIAGRYEGNNVITRETDGLWLSGVGPQPVKLSPLSPSRFLLTVGGTTFVLEFASPNGKVESFTVVGVGFTAKRLPE